MPGIDTKIRHYQINHDTGERTLNTDFNIFLALNAVSYLVFLILIFTVGAFGNVSSTTEILAYRYRTVLTPGEVFFKTVWSVVIPWHAVWVVWQIVQPAYRNSEGVVRASVYYPFMTVMYAGYTVSCRYNAMILGAVFSAGLTGTMIGLVMSLQRYRGKNLPGYMIWQAPHSLMGAWSMVETVLMTNAVFVVLGEEWIIRVVIACLSLVVIFVTAIAWLSSYPVDLMVPGVLCFAAGGIYTELLLDDAHYTNLFRQGYSDDWLTGAKYTVLAVFLLILVSIFLKILVVLVHQRPREQEDRRRRVDPRTSISITIDTGTKTKTKDNETKKKKKKPRRNRNTDDDYYNDYDDDHDEERPRRTRSRSREHRRGSGDRNKHNSNKNNSDKSKNNKNNRRGSGRGGQDEESPRRSKPKKKAPRKKKQESYTSTSYDDDDENY